MAGDVTTGRQGAALARAGQAGAGTARPRLRAGFRDWRYRRPFWGGLLLTLGGAEILLTEKASLKVVLHIGMQGLAGYLLPALMVLLGLLTLFNPAQRLFYSLTGILLSLGTWLTSNLGGFFVGLLLGATGSCLAFGWLPDQGPRRGRRWRRRTAQPQPQAQAPAQPQAPAPAQPQAEAGAGAATGTGAAAATAGVD